jgi:hypothetical protein
MHEARIVVGLLGLLTAAAGCAGRTPSGATGPSRGACDLAGRVWQQTSTGPCTSSTWTFYRNGDTWAAHESGCNDGDGSAILAGQTFPSTLAPAP